MTIQCIVCNSTAVIHKDAAKAMAVLVSIISSAIQGAATSAVANQPAQAAFEPVAGAGSCWSIRRRNR